MKCSLADFYKADWFQQRPQHIKELFYKYPVNQEWFLRAPNKDRYYGIRIMGFEEHGDNEPTARVFVGGCAPHFYERRVSGIPLGNIFSAEQVQGKEIMYHTPDIYDIY